MLVKKLLILIAAMAMLPMTACGEGVPEKPRAIKQAEVDEFPHIIWNTFIDMVAGGAAAEMNDIQRNAALCFEYDSEVQNGGHLQYFENTARSGFADYEDVVKALQWIGAGQQADVLSKAIALWKLETRGLTRDIYEFSDRALEGRYDALDDKYCDCEPEVMQLLETMLEEYQDEFVIIE